MDPKSMRMEALTKSTVCCGPAWLLPLSPCTTKYVNA